MSKVEFFFTMTELVPCMKYNTNIGQGLLHHYFSTSLASETAIARQQPIQSLRTTTRYYNKHLSYGSSPRAPAWGVHGPVILSHLHGCAFTMNKCK